MIDTMMIGQLAQATGLTVRTLRFYADEGIVPAVGRSAAGYRLFGPEALARARLVHTLRELGVGLDDIKRVLSTDTTLVEVVTRHDQALSAQIRQLQLQRVALGVFLRTSDQKDLETMSDLINLTAAERRRIVEDYLDAVFGDSPNVVADKIATATPDLPDEPTPAQLAAWVEVAGLLRDPDFIDTSKRMAERARLEGPEPDVARFDVGKAVGEFAAPAARADVEPGSTDALAVVERIEGVSDRVPEDRLAVAERIEAFTDRRVARYWTLVGIVNGWPESQAPDDLVDAWEWYAQALRAHAG